MGYREEREMGVSRTGGAPPVAPAQPGGGWETPVDPYWWLDYQKYGTGAEQWGMGFEEQIRQFDATIAQEIELSKMAEAGAIQRAQIAASATTGAAGIYSQADIDAANIDAAAARYHTDTLMKIAQLDNKIKLQIAQESNKIEAMKWEATRFQHPGKWAEQEAWYAAGGAPAIETPTRSVVPQLPGATPVGSAAGAQAAGWGTPPAMDITAPQAVVAEAGQPELVTATAQGAQITPLEQQQAWFLKKQGVPGMQGGGMVKSSYTGPGRTTYRPSGGYTAGMGPSGSFSRLPVWQRQVAAEQAMTGLGGTQTAAGATSTPSAPSPATPTPTPTPTPAPVPTPTPAPGGAITPSVLSYLRGETPYPSWGGQQIGQYQIPGGPNYGDVPLPGQINLVDFLRLPLDLQEMYKSATEATYSMTPGQTMQWMSAFAPRGIASPVAVWG